MIYANIELIIKRGEVIANNTLCLYRGDKNVEVRFILKDNHFVIHQNTFAQLLIKRPNANSIFSEVSQIQDNTVVFLITGDMINELNEIGYYDIQIRLFDDNLNARATLPPVMSALEIRSPLIDDGVVGVATVGYATAIASNEEEDTFLEDGSYNATSWVDGDIISAEKLNKVEDALSVINDKVPSIEGLATEEYVNQEIDKIDVTEQLTDYAKKSELPTKTSQLTNDSNFLTSVPSEYITETELQTHTDQVLSAGEQLVLNGSQTLQNNYNFSQLEYDGSQANNSGGSLLSDAGKRQDVVSDLFFTINPNKPLYVSFDVKGELGSSMYAYVGFYDVDKQAISATHHMYQANTLTRLTQDLKNGDTVVYLEDLTNWREDLTAGHQRSFIFWNYTNEKGYTYPVETYSRNMYSSIYTDSSSIDKVNNTITLSSAWSKGTIPAGTYLSQGSSGNNYKYIKGGKLTITTEWQTHSGGYDGVDYTGTNNMYKFPPGVAFAKFGMFLNYGNVADEKIWITNIVVKEDIYSAIEEKADKSELHSHSNKTVIDGITSTKITEWDNKSTFSGNYEDLTNKPTIPTVPTNISAFTNDKGYLTSVPSEYVTDDELTAKGYATTSYVNNLSEDINELSVFVTPQMFGAKGDGTTDDTVALQNAFNSVAENGKYLFIPHGTYKVTSPITVDWSYNSGSRRNFLQKIIGAGSASYEKYYDNTVIVGYNIPAYRGVIELIGDGNTWGTQTRIEDLAIECDETSCDTMSFALMYGDARNFKLSRVKLRGHNGIYARCGSVVDTNGNSITRGYEQMNIKFEQCDIYSFESSTRGFAFLPEGINTGSFATMDNILVDSCVISGVWVVSSVNIMFQSCHTAIRNIENKLITTDNVGLLNGYEVDYGTGYYIGQAMSAVFQNCYFEDFRRGIQITPTLGNIRNVSIMNCYLNPGCNQFNSNGERICADYGIRISQGASDKEVRNVLVQNNVFRLIEGDTEYNIANVSNEFANRFVFRDNCTTSTQVVPKVVNTTETGYDICNDITEGSSIKGMTSANDGKELTIHLTNGLSYTVKGSTPIKGVDYFTEAELEEITENASDLAKAELQQISPPTWVETVEDMTDTSKHYVLQSSGNIWAYMKHTKITPGTSVATFTNRIEDPNAYIKDGQRYSLSSAAFKTQASDCAIVIPIPSASSYYIRVRGAMLDSTCTYPTSIYFGTTNASFTAAPTNGQETDIQYGMDSNGDVYINVTKPPTGTWTYVVFHVNAGVDIENLIVTVNEEITYTTTEDATEVVMEWTDTGYNIIGH